MDPFVVLACRCGRAWAAESRHATSACPACRTRVRTATHRRLWSGGDARQAQAAAAAAMGPASLPAAPTPRHDDVLDAVAATARRVRNLSARASAVAAHLLEVEGTCLHERLVEALARAGLDEARAEREVVRMLATDEMFEPRAGAYSCVRDAGVTA